MAGGTTLLAVAGFGWQAFKYVQTFATKAELAAHAQVCASTTEWERRLTDRTNSIAADVAALKDTATKTKESYDALIGQINGVQLRILEAVLPPPKGRR